MKHNNGKGLWLWCGGILVLLALACLLLWGREPAGRYAAAGLLALAAVALWMAWGRFRDRYRRPLEDLARLADDWLEADPRALCRRARDIQGPPGDVARVLADRMEQLEERVEDLRRTAGDAAERRVRRQLTGELCRSALPQVLRESPATAAFRLAGGVEEGGEPSCTFYDYFFIDPGLLCVAVGQVPGGSVSEALYMVVAQTTIRSRIRMGRSLVETMADVNMQLYDLGAQQSLCALVGTLNTANGTFSYVNAGCALPLILRNEGRYEWLEAPVYAALGMNENVSYRLMSLRLRQGDRLFLQTAGLGEMRSRDGTAFGDQALRAALNRSRAKAQSPEEILRFVADEAAAHCPSDGDRVGYAALVLEYRKGDKELAHCQVPAVPASAREVTDFLKKQFDDNGIQKRYYARVAVLVDEMFALCCRTAKGQGAVTTECGIAPDGQSVTIRMSAALGGVDPTEAGGDLSDRALEFIHSQVDYLTFKAGEERDTITAVCFLEDASAAMSPIP